jgi:ribonuclease P protein component
MAYAVNRRVGSAVLRNRLKRRLRAIVSEQVSSLPAGTYMVRVGPGGSLLGFDELRVAMNQALERATSGQSRPSPVMATPDHGGAR